MILFKIDWAPNEVFLNLGPLTIYWYSVMFIIAFSLGYYIVQKIYINDNKPVELVEPLFIYVVFGTLYLEQDLVMYFFITGTIFKII